MSRVSSMMMSAAACLMAVLMHLVVQVPVVQSSTLGCREQQGRAPIFLPQSECSEDCRRRNLTDEVTATLSCGTTDLSLTLSALIQNNDRPFLHVQISCTSETNTTVFRWCSWYTTLVSKVEGFNQTDCRTIQLDSLTELVESGTNLPGTVCTVDCIPFDHGDICVHPNDFLVHSCTIEALPPRVVFATDSVKEGDVLNLTCINDNPAGVTQQWLDSNGEVVSSDTSFILENVTRDYAGEYTCILYGVNNYTISETVTVTVKYKPQLTTIKETLLNVIVGDNVSLSCGYDGVPTPTVRWLYNNVELINDTDQSVTITKEGDWSILFLSSIELESTGSYSCVAKNSVGEEASSTFINVSVQLVFPATSGPSSPAETELVPTSHVIKQSSTTEALLDLKAQEDVATGYVIAIAILSTSLLICIILLAITTLITAVLYYQLRRHSVRKEMVEVEFKES